MAKIRKRIILSGKENIEGQKDEQNDLPEEEQGSGSQEKQAETQDELIQAVQSIVNEMFEPNLEDFVKNTLHRNYDDKQGFMDFFKSTPLQGQKFIANELKDYIQNMPSEDASQNSESAPGERNESDSSSEGSNDDDNGNWKLFEENVGEMEDFSKRDEDQSIDDYAQNGLKKAVDVLAMILARLDILEFNVTGLNERVKSLETSKKDVDETLSVLATSLKDVTELLKKQRDNEKKDDEVTEYKVTKRVTAKEMQKSFEGAVPAEFKRIVELASARKNIMLWGPTGSGKSFLANKVAEIFELPFFAQSCSEGMDETIFTGRILPDVNGAWTYRSSTFMRLYENGGVYCLDEGDRADSNLLTFINTALSNGFIFNELDNGRQIKRHNDFICIMTCNSAGHGGDTSYLTNELDVSTLRRFQTGKVYVGYDNKVEETLIEPNVLAWGRIMRQVIDALRIDRMPISTGLLIDLSDMYYQGWKLSDIESAVFSGMPSEKVKQCRSQFKTILDREMRNA